MGRRCICIAAVIGVLVGLVLPGRAAEETGSLRVMPLWCGRPVTGGSITLSRVGSRRGADFLVTDGLADWRVSEQEIFSGEWAGRLSGWAREAPAMDSAVREEGAVFSGLEQGLYLVQQKEASDGLVFSPFLVSVPQGELWEVAAWPKAVYTGESPRTGDRPAPILGAMGIGLSVAVLMVLAEHRKK